MTLTRRLLFAVWPPLPIWKGLDIGVGVVVIYSLIVEFICDHWDIKTSQNASFLNLFNVLLLSVLLAFRNLQAYDRWWEARKLWGQLINDSRNLALKVKNYIAQSESERYQSGLLIHRFALALKYHLRDRRRGIAAPQFAEPGKTIQHWPAHIADRIFAQLRGWQTQSRMSDGQLIVIDPHARALMDVCGACERIQSSPVPLSYRSLLRHGTLLYLLSAPWLMADDYDYWSVLLNGLIAYFVLGIELTAESIEDPFGTDGDDLELTRYCETIRTSVEEILDVRLPAPDATVEIPANLAKT